MLMDINRLIGYPVLSLHVSGMIAKVTEPIIDPDNLKIVAFFVTGPDVGNGEHGDILQVDDIREFSELGMVIDSIDEFVNADDIVKLRDIINLNFSLIDKKVETKKKTKLGKVTSYTVNPDDFIVQQIIVQRPLMKSFLDPELTISRSEIVKVDDEKVTVRDEEKKIMERAAKEDFVPNFVNPFREPQLSRADSQTLDEPNTQ
ncbi:hypothetical protein IKG12_02765 [Candidatus Saccharibacteria bacterium]|nr:hypothetical protein [Candidatus Saccharibacteria bacterium]MBR3233755.1 hypothetical protein [Candidatus Saccharibacteria bacterium]